MNNLYEGINTDNLKKMNQESKSLTRDYIKTALLYLLKDNPYEKITVTAIINRAGVSRAGFYRNYASKEDVLEDLAATVYYQVSNSFFKNEDLKSPYEKYLLFFQRLQTNVEWFRILSVLSLHNKQIFNISTYIKNNTPPKSPNEHYRYIAAFHSQRAIILHWVENGMKESPEEMATFFCELYKDAYYMFI